MKSILEAIFARPKVYHLNSIMNGGYEKEHAYLLKSNGVINKDHTSAWIEETLTFRKDKFWLCKPGKKFILAYHTAVGNQDVIISHTYETTQEGNIVRVTLIDIDEQWSRKKKYKLFKVPEN